MVLGVLSWDAWDKGLAVGLSKQGKGLNDVKGVVSRCVSDFVFFAGAEEKRGGRLGRVGVC